MNVTMNEEITSLFREWFDEASKKEINNPNAMSLATASSSGIPSVRIVLLKEYDERGFVFYTNLTSRKGVELEENPNASLCFHWKSMDRQIRIEGHVEKVSDDQADAYFASRPRSSRIGAWASKQSQQMEGRFEFEGRIAKYTAKFGIGDVPRPEFWSGLRLVPNRIEFWNEYAFRLHDRNVYVNDGAEWRLDKLYP
jgi:pyridoxamine 5'-phosphate oxidase